MSKQKTLRRQARHRRIRSKVRGTAERPRLSIFRSLQRLSIQLIDDETGKTLCSATTAETKASLNKEGAKKLGALLAKKAKEAKITSVVFDRSGYKYHGRVQALADSAREAGLKF